MAFNIDEFQSNLAQGGAISSHFQVTITNPVNPVADIRVPFLCKAANIPSATLNTIEQKYFGRAVPFASGNRTYEPWTVTIINDEDFAIKDALEDWQEAINNPSENTTTLGTASPLSYKSDAQVTQYSKTGSPIKTIELIGIYPETIGEITLDWENGEEIETFDVTFRFSYHRRQGGVTEVI